MRLLTRVVATALCSLPYLCITAPVAADDSADTVNKVADELRDDPILIHEVMGAGDTAGMEKRLTDLAADLPYDTYVALVNAPPDIAQKTDNPSEYLLQLLHRRLDRPGLYIVQTTKGSVAVEAWGTDVDGTTLRLTASDNSRLIVDRLGELHGDDIRTLPAPVYAEVVLRSADDPPSEPGDDSYVTMSSDEVDEIADMPQAYVSTDTLVEPEESRTGFKWMVVVGSALFILLVVQQTLRRAWPGWRRGPKKAQEPAPTPKADVDVEKLRDRARRELTELATGLSQTPADMSNPEYVQQAMLARTAAEHLHDSDDVADVVGVLVLAYTGQRDLVRARTPEPPEPYRCCYFNPLHGEHTAQVGWQFGDATLHVPVCAACASAQKSGRTPDSLTVRRGRTERPYYERDDVWARTGFGSLTDELGDAVLEARR